MTSGLLTDLLEDSMWQIGHGMPPPDLANKAVVAKLRRLVKKHQISTVIVGPMEYQDTMLRFMTRVMGRAPEAIGGVYVWYGAGK